MKTNLILSDKKLGKENNQKIVDLIRELYPYLSIDAVANLTGLSRTKVKEILKANNITKEEDPSWYINIPIVIWLPKKLYDKIDIENLKFIEK